jgi:hypothetical protein
MMAAGLKLPRPVLWGIGVSRIGSELVDFEIGWDEIARDTEWARSVLTTSGIQSGDRVLITTGHWESPWTSPLVHAIRRIGAVYVPSEAYKFDARRFRHYIESVGPKAVIGLNSELLGALPGLEVDPAELLKNVDVLWACGDTVASLAQIGLLPQPFVRLGPALAIGIPSVGTVVNSAEWSVSEDSGTLHVSTAAPRATAFNNVDTGVHGQVVSRSPHGTVIQIES